MNPGRAINSRRHISLKTANRHLMSRARKPIWPVAHPRSFLAVLLFGVVLVVAPRTAKAEEIWKLSEAFTDFGTGFLAHGNLVYQSNLSQADIINAFQPPATKKRVRAIYVSILERTGSYAGTFTLLFEVRDFNGNVQSIVSSETIDLKTASTRVWIPVPLSQSGSDRDIAPGEFLAVHVSREGVLGGDLTVFPIFEAIVR
jgi:hypothetical protein